LAQGTTTPVAAALANMRIPYLVVSGYLHIGVLKAMQAAPFVGKPYFHEEVVDAVVPCLGERRPHSVQ
jgi:hypothetical protein